jgi:hypothetical protein
MTETIESLGVELKEKRRCGKTPFLHRVGELMSGRHLLLGSCAKNQLELEVALHDVPRRFLVFPCV